MRNSSFKSDLFSGGRGGQSFAMIYDQHLADRMARGAGRRLAAGIVRHIERPRSPSQLLHQQSPQPSSPQTPSAGNATTHVSPTH
jgi:Rod binding domain-containing protein